MAQSSASARCESESNDDLQIIEVISGDSSNISLNELDKLDDIEDLSDYNASIYEENSLEFQIYSDEEDESNLLGDKNKTKNQTEDDDDCIILEGEQAKEQTTPNTSVSKTPKKSKKVKTCKKKELKIHCGMKVYALFDQTRHIWRLASIVNIKNSVSKNEHYKENTIKLRSNAKYLVKFEQTNYEATTEKNIIEEYDNNYHQPQQQQQQQTNRNNTNNANNSKDEDDEIIVIEDENEPTEKRAKTCNQKQELVELDATCIAFIQSGADNPLPNVPYIDYDSSLNTLILPVRSRVIATYELHIDDTDKSSKILTNKYLCSATIAELPSARNSKRYLVFFDNGFVSYVSPQYAYPIFDLFRLPIDRLSYDHIYFTRYYFDNYPERAMVRLEKNDSVKLFLNNKWYDTRVIDVDVSLVKLTLDLKMFENLYNQRNLPSTSSGNSTKRFNSSLNSHSIWFYRGSYRLLPLYEVIMNKLTKLEDPVELNQYEKYIKEKQNDSIFYNSQCLSSFASTSFPNIGPTSKYKIRRDNNEIKVVQGQLKALFLDNLMRNSLVKFKAHSCSTSCVTRWERNLEFLSKPVNPLLVPCFYGWQRHLCHQSKTLNTASKRWITYMGPCGRILRSTGEVDRYLFITNSKLTIDMFSFDSNIHTDREFEANAKYLNIDDIAEGKEASPVSAVNCVDTVKPDEIEYSAERLPLEGVPLNTSTELMDGCKCQDNCRDRSKCACWRKTFEATTFAYNSQPNTSVGYRGRRLYEMVNTGIFECNAKCKCDHRCSNRVVQNGISLRLQLFKTTNKGWGLRCLDDIPKGAFVCVYNGHLITEEQSDIRGVEFGDEYFAELDFVECLRRLKQGFIFQPDEFQTDTDSSESCSLNNSKSSSLNYQAKTSKKTISKNRLLPRKNLITQNSEIDYVFLDSDEDEQDRLERNFSNSDHHELERSRMRHREERERRVTSLINSNRFFTNPNNPFYYGDYLRDSKIFIMDAKLCGNIGRYFNHSCSPNLFVQNVFVDTYDLRFPWIAFFALNSIKAGTELTWDYNYTIDSVPGRQLYCYCNSSNCRGRLI